MNNIFDNWLHTSAIQNNKFVRKYFPFRQILISLNALNFYKYTGFKFKIRIVSISFIFMCVFKPIMVTFKLNSMLDVIYYPCKLPTAITPIPTISTMFTMTRAGSIPTIFILDTDYQICAPFTMFTIMFGAIPSG